MPASADDARQRQRLGSIRIFRGHTRRKTHELKGQRVCARGVERLHDALINREVCRQVKLGDARRKTDELLDLRDRLALAHAAWLLHNLHRGSGV